MSITLLNGSWVHTRRMGSEVETDGLDTGLVLSSVYSSKKVIIFEWET